MFKLGVFPSDFLLFKLFRFLFWNKFLLYTSRPGWIFCLVSVNGLSNVDVMGFSKLIKWSTLIAIRTVTRNRY